MQHRGSLLHLAGDGFDSLARRVVFAAVVLDVGFTHAQERYEEHQDRYGNDKSSSRSRADHRSLHPPQHGSEACRDAQPEDQEGWDEEHVEVLDPELQVNGGLTETPEEEHAEKDGRRAVREE